MSFFLLGKTTGEKIYLVWETAFATRGEALRQLSHITGDASFDAWDDEILVIDDQAGAPVLLVRPSTSEPAHQVEDAMAVETPVADEVEVFEAGEELPEETVVEEAETGPEAEQEAEEEVSGGAELAIPLKDALLRSAVQLESEGIQAPDSVGPEPEPPTENSESEGENDVPVGEMTEEAGASEPVGEEPSLEEETPVESASPEAPAEESGTQTPSASEESASEQAPAAWPWDSEGGMESLGVSELDEPGDDEESLVRAAGDDETMASARPVIMGSYEDETVLAPLEIVESEGATELPEQVPVREVAGVVEAEIAPGADIPAEAQDDPVELAAALDAPDVPAEPVGETVTELPSIDPASDFVDLTSRVDFETAAEASPPIDTMTCNDCVYVETCPNQGQRLPASCGSFQWK